MTSFLTSPVKFKEAGPFPSQNSASESPEYYLKAAA
jgi:hypothetical protein